MLEKKAKNQQRQLQVGDIPSVGPFNDCHLPATRYFDRIKSLTKTGVQREL
jgi:hypothetical protein